jgi:hypothetical protein
MSKAQHIDVMAGLVPAIQAFFFAKQHVDARHQAGHDAERQGIEL